MAQQEKQVTSSDLIYKLAQAGHMIDHELDAALEAHGLSVAKLGVLRHLAEAEGPITLGQLAERLACVKSNVTQLIDRLEAEGLAKRVPDQEDRRSVRAVITDKGRQSYEAGRKAQLAAEGKLLQALSSEEQGRLATLLEHFAGGRQ